MNCGKTVFSQIMDFLPSYELKKCVIRYNGHYKVKSFSCLNQYYCMSFAQLAYRESLRDIEACLHAAPGRLYQMGIRGKVCKSTLADANANRDWRIYADFAQKLIPQARNLYSKEDFGVELENVTYALDASTIDLCLSVFPWAKFRKIKGAVKLHTLLDLRGNIPAFIWITDGKVHDVNILDDLIPEPGAFYIMDRAYIDFSRLYLFKMAMSFFVIRAKKNMQFRRLYSTPVDKSTGLRADQTIILTGINSQNAYPEKIRRIKYYDNDKKKTLIFLTNNFSIKALDIANLYKQRWQIELFFKWIKQHLRIKKFYGNTENAVKTQIWIAVSVYVLIAIIKKRLELKLELYTILQILSLSLFEKVPINELLTTQGNQDETIENYNQLMLFNL